MMMFNIFIHDLEVNMKSVLIRFGMTRISREVGTLTRGSCGGCGRLRRCPAQTASQPRCHGEPRWPSPTRDGCSPWSWPPKQRMNPARSARAGCRAGAGRSQGPRQASYMVRLCQGAARLCHRPAQEFLMWTAVGHGEGPVKVWYWGRDGKLKDGSISG